MRLLRGVIYRARIRRAIRSLLRVYRSVDVVNRESIEAAIIVLLRNGAG